MNDIALDRSTLAPPTASQAVGLAVKTWFALATVGHWLFLAYILAVFYPPVAEHGMRALEGSHLPGGFIEGDAIGNLAAIGHVLLAAIVIGGGPLQLIPAVRTRFPRFHRWLGRSYLLSAVISAAFGLYMTWTRSSIGDFISHAGITVDGVLIIVFATFAVYHAVGRRIAEHRRWALRLFMVASAVWFFRVGLMGWVLLTGGVGIDWEPFTGPFLYVLGFAQYLLPLAMLEWYFHCQRGGSTGSQLAFAGTLSLLTVYMGLGIFTATTGMWLPRM